MACSSHKCSKHIISLVKCCLLWRMIGCIWEYSSFELYSLLPTWRKPSESMNGLSDCRLLPWDRCFPAKTHPSILFSHSPFSHSGNEEGCLICHHSIKSALMLEQLQLEWVTPETVFEKVGFDYAGPLRRMAHKPISLKSYICIFVLTVKAVHLEAVSDLTSAALWWFVLSWLPQCSSEVIKTLILSVLTEKVRRCTSSYHNRKLYALLLTYALVLA